MEDERYPYWGVCDVNDCNNENCNGGGCWRETGYWQVCSIHSQMWRDGKPQPKMKKEAIAIEATRDPITRYLPSVLNGNYRPAQQRNFRGTIMTNSSDEKIEGTELLACPFCGKVPKLQKDEAINTWFLECPDQWCIATPTSILPNESKEELIRIWNIRVPDVVVPVMRSEYDVASNAQTLMRRITEYLWCTNGLPCEFPEHMEDGLVKILQEELERAERNKENGLT